MTDPLAKPAPSPAIRLLLVGGGVLFIIGWMAAHLIWVYLSLMANLMANDSGAASSARHLSLIFGMLAGQALAAAAGFPAGLAWFWEGKRKKLLTWFAILFASGALLQILVFSAFFWSMS